MDVAAVDHVPVDQRLSRAPSWGMLYGEVRTFWEIGDTRETPAPFNASFECGEDAAGDSGGGFEIRSMLLHAS